MSGNVERLRDEIAVLEYRRGDTGALAELVSRWQRRIWVYISAMLCDDEAAWDVSQEVWVAVVKALGGRKEIRCFSAWLYRTAHNRCVSYLRRRGRQREIEDKRTDGVENAIAPEGEAIFGAEEAQFVCEAMTKLPLLQREALTLFYLDDMSLKEIGAVLGAPVGTVQSRLHHGRLKLKAILLRKGSCHG